VCGVADEEVLADWQAAWERANDQQQRFGSTALNVDGLPQVSTLLEVGPDQAAQMVLRRSIPEAAAELSKVGPGTAAKILRQWPPSTVAEILAAMDRQTSAAVLLSLRSAPKLQEIINGMSVEKVIDRLSQLSDDDAATVARSAQAVSELLQALPVEVRELVENKRRADSRWDVVGLGSIGLLLVYGTYSLFDWVAYRRRTRREIEQYVGRLERNQRRFWIKE
jgi:Mg/Co/Ni transporter MgtE